MSKQSKSKTTTAQDSFIREWVLLCFEQMGYTSLALRKAKTKSALELIQNRTLSKKKNEKTG